MINRRVIGLVTYSAAVAIASALDYVITLTTGSRLTLSRGYRDRFKSRLESARR